MGNKKKGMYDPKTGIFIEHKYRLDVSLADKIMELFSPKLVSDLGCGTGHYCKYFYDISRWNVHGYEGNVSACENKVHEFVKCVDLTKPLETECEYDLTICLEVGEHLPKIYENIFIDNITNISNNILILSWAVKNQGGKGHVNCQENDYVINKMENKGFKFLPDITKELRDASTFRFFKNTIMVFKKEQYIEER